MAFILPHIYAPVAVQSAGVSPLTISTLDQFVSRSCILTRPTSSKLIPTTFTAVPFVISKGVVESTRFPFSSFVVSGVIPSP